MKMHAGGSETCPVVSMAESCLRVQVHPGCWMECGELELIRQPAPKGTLDKENGSQDQDRHVLTLFFGSGRPRPGGDARRRRKKSVHEGL